MGEDKLLDLLLKESDDFAARTVEKKDLVYGYFPKDYDEIKDKIVTVIHKSPRQFYTELKPLWRLPSKSSTRRIVTLSMIELFSRCG